MKLRLVIVAAFAAVASAACFSPVGEVECLRDTDCDGGTCQGDRCVLPGQGGGTGGGVAGGGTGGAMGGGPGGAMGGGTGGAMGGGTGGGVTGGGTGGGVTGGGTGGGVTGGGAGGGGAVCGCRDPLGQCQVGNSPVACGTGGGACMTCGVGQQCVGGACVTAACGPGTCAGCCTNNFCVVTQNQNRFACGTNGGACAQCPQGQTCLSGTCGTPVCDVTTCPTGCCQNGQCMPGTSRNACGTAAGVCQQCSGSQRCVAGLCVAGGFDGGMAFDAGTPVPVGSPCASSQACQPPQGAFCVQESLIGQATGYVGGYCTAQCSSTSPCVGGAVCITETQFGAQVSSCRAACPTVGVQSTCRTGYVCAPSPVSSMAGGFCRPRCTGGSLAGCPMGQTCDATSGLCQ